MDLYSIIIENYPELAITEDNNNFGYDREIQLRDDGDGIQYIAKWEYSKPIPNGLKLGK